MAAIGGITKFQQYTVGAAAGGFIVPVTGMPKPVGAQCQVTGGGIRYTTDGSTPTGTVGFDVPAGSTFILQDYGQLKRFLAIRSGAGDATLNVEFGSDWTPGG